MSKGRLIVIDGLDGSGKATQTRLLAERFAREQVPVATIDFPRYGVSMFGTLIGECLAGKRGDFLHLDPKIASTLYALDRHEASAQITAWLEEGKTVIADRLTSSNQIHQGGKIEDAEERERFLSWLDRLEHEVLSVPRPDAVVYLHVPIEVTARLLGEKRAEKNGELTGSAHDVVEKDRQYAENSYRSARALAESSAHWRMIECAPGGVMRSPDDIHEEVYRIVSAL